MIIKRIEEKNNDPAWSELLLWLTNLATLILLWSQNVKITAFNEKLLAMSLNNEQMKHKLQFIEKAEKHTIIVKNVSQVNDVSLLKWLLIALVFAISLYCAYLAYIKWMGFSFISLLPDLPLGWVPFLKKSDFFECILGDYTLRINLSSNKINSIQAKHINELGYKPLEDVLEKSGDISGHLISNATRLLVDVKIPDETAQKVTEKVVEKATGSTGSMESLESLISPLFFEPPVIENTLSTLDTIQSVLGSI